MSVSVSLLKLVATDGTQDVWPDEFRTAMDKVKEDKSERNALAVLADWLRDVDEPWLEKAVRFYLKRPGMTIDVKMISMANTIYYDFAGKPKGWEYTTTYADTIGQLFSTLAEEIKKRTEELE